MANNIDYWADALPAWVPLAKLFATVERQLGVPPEESRDVLRLGLETMRIRTLVVDGDDFRFRNGPRRNWVTEGNERRECRVSREGWPRVLWEHGTLEGHEIRVYWDDVPHSLASIIARNRRDAVERTKRANQVRESPKGKGGRPPSPHSDAFWIKVAIWVENNGFERAGRTTLQKEMEDWAIQASDDPDKPVYSAETIRDKLRALYERATRKM